MRLSGVPPGNYPYSGDHNLFIINGSQSGGISVFAKKLAELGYEVLIPDIKKAAMVF